MGSSKVEQEHQFGKVRGFLWPIHNHELKRLIPLLLIFFLIAFNYNVLRTMKDTLVVYGKGSGAEVIPFIKSWFMFPGSILMTYLFARLSNRFTLETVFYIIVGGFLCYFALFVTLLYPNREALHFHEAAEKVAHFLPATLKVGLKGLIAAFSNWTFTLFYVMSELWSSVVLFMLMWGFVNQVTRLTEAKRFYAVFGIGINISGVFAGQASIYLGNRQFDPSFMFGNTAWEQSMFSLLMIVLVVGVISLLLFRWLNQMILAETGTPEEEAVKLEVKAKGKMSMRESLRLLSKSRYLICISVIVLIYGAVINLVEVLWKHEVKQLYSDPNDYNSYMNYVTTVIGVVATFVSLFISGNFIRRLGWYFTAMITPVVLLITSIAFFGTFFAQEYFPQSFQSYFGVAPLVMVVFFGSLQNVLSRAAKYTVFDATREMAFIPLPLDLKLKGKAVIDGVFSRMGKSSAAILYQVLFITFGSISGSMPVVSVFLFAAIMVWFKATHMLGVEFANLTEDKKQPALKTDEPLAEQLV